MVTKRKRRVVAAARLAGFLAFTATVALLAASLGCHFSLFDSPGDVFGGGDRRNTGLLDPLGGPEGIAQPDANPPGGPPFWTDANLLGALGTGIGTIALAFWVRWNSYKVQKPEWEAKKRLMNGKG